jgi:glycosyltransferase involved in cell wall biosynthesis
MLVLAGAKGWMMERFLADVASDQSLAARVRITGFVADADLPALYSGAMAFVFPSLYEGFGLPPLEAMACGAPVICSNTSSLPEVVGDAALTVSPTDVAALSDAMRQVAGSHALQEDLGQRGMHRATEFTWERTTRQYMELYSSLCEGHGVPEHLREVGI